jgi:hypothetical protein
VGISTYYWTLQSVCVLYGIVAMIPRCSILNSFKAVRETVTWGNRTLSDTVNSVHVHRSILSNPMPMNARAILFHTVDDSDVKCLLTREY